MSALAVLVRPAAGSASSATAGLLLGFATAVKLTNGVIELVLAPLVARRHGVRAAALYAGGGLLFAPLVAVYWDKGYVANYGGEISASDEPWGLGYAVDNWTDSLLFTPTLLVLLARRWRSSAAHCAQRPLGGRRPARRDRHDSS